MNAKLAIGLCATLALGCGSGDPQDYTYQEFLSEFAGAYCTYKTQCGSTKAHADCVNSLAGDLSRDFNCNGARGLYQDLKAGLLRCVDGSEKPCTQVDDYDLFCPSARLLERECKK